MEDRLAPGLHIVATPIGNLGDLSPRAAETLRRADRILVEDTGLGRAFRRALVLGDRDIGGQPEHQGHEQGRTGGPAGQPVQQGGSGSHA